MIQRIQTIWLAISALSSGLLLKGGMVNFLTKAGEKYFIDISGANRLTDAGEELIRGFIPLTSVLILIPVISVAAILLYKSRKTQKMFTMLLIALSVLLTGLLIFYSYIIMKEHNADFIIGIRMLLPLIILISAILAYRGISKDDRLVKSYDRIR